MFALSMSAAMVQESVVAPSTVSAMKTVVEGVVASAC